MWGKGHASPQRKTAHEQSMVIGFLVERLEPAVASLKENGGDSRYRDWQLSWNQMGLLYRP
jgi:hypothetical protein